MKSFITDTASLLHLITSAVIKVAPAHQWMSTCEGSATSCVRARAEEHKLGGKNYTQFHAVFYFLSFTEPLFLFSNQYGTSIQLPKGFIMFSFSTAPKDV